MSILCCAQYKLLNAAAKWAKTDSFKDLRPLGKVTGQYRSVQFFVWILQISRLAFRHKQLCTVSVKHMALEQQLLTTLRFLGASCMSAKSNY